MEYSLKSKDYVEVSLRKTTKSELKMARFVICFLTLCVFFKSLDPKEKQQMTKTHEIKVSFNTLSPFHLQVDKYLIGIKEFSH